MTIFKKVAAAEKAKYVRYSTAQAGDLLVEGVYEGSPLVKNYAKTADVPQHRFKTAEGEIVILNSAGALDRDMKSVTAGDLVRITFLGKEKYVDKETKALKTANKFEVCVAEDV